MLEPGQKLFEYEIVRVVGRGGFATVYEARDRMLERRLAIKELFTEKATTQKSIKRFVQEARVVAALEHPNIITIHGLRFHKQRIYMILEYLPGGSLQDSLNKNGKVALGPAIKLVTGISEGLAKLHARGIIHRDIKPENMLLTADGLPKITDFGIAHVPQAAGGMALTQAGFQPSTVIYSSPEQFRGEQLDARSDIYQMGELLYHLLTGKHYIDIEDIHTQADTLGHNLKRQVALYMLLEKAVCKDPPVGLSALRQEVGGVAGVIEKALAKRKEERYDDILDFAADLWAAQFKSGRI